MLLATLRIRTLARQKVSRPLRGVPVEIGESSEPIPVRFAYRRDISIETLLSDGEKLRTQRPMRDVFDTPDLAAMDDAIANGKLQWHPSTPEPHALFRAARVDYSLHQLFHYTGTDPEHFQNFVIFTNYQFYVDAFGRLGHDHMASGRAGRPNEVLQSAASNPSSSTQVRDPS